MRPDSLLSPRILGQAGVAAGSLWGHVPSVQHKRADVHDRDRGSAVQARTTYFLLAVAIFVECYQLVRAVFNDWTQVWFTRRYAMSPAQGAGFASVEKAVIIWHIATWECHNHLDVDTPGQTVPEEVSRALQLSRYALYLVAYRPEFFPSISVQPVYEKARRDVELQGRRAREDVELQERAGLTSADAGARQPLTEEALQHLAKNDLCLAGQRVAQTSTDRPEKWDVLAGVFTDFIITIARISDPRVHIQLLAGEGESFTKIWLMLHHLEFRLVTASRLCPEHSHGVPQPEVLPNESEQDTWVPPELFDGSESEPPEVIQE